MPIRLFQTRGFAYRARKALISEAELQRAFSELLNGQGDPMGGGVWKKRLGANRYRAILLGKGGDCWVYQFLFAKQDRSNIDLKELLVFRELAKSYARLDAWQIQQMIEIEEFVEIAHD